MWEEERGGDGENVITGECIHIESYQNLTAFALMVNIQTPCIICLGFSVTESLMEHFGLQLQRTLVSDNGQGMMVFIVMRMCDGGATLHGAPGSCESDIEPGVGLFPSRACPW